MLPASPAFRRRVRPSSSIAALMSVTTTRPRAPDAPREADGEIAAAGRDVERLLAGSKARLRDREALPQPMQPARHHVVHEVVARCDRIENAAHAGLLLVPRHALVAEVGGGRGRRRWWSWRQKASLRSAWRTGRRRSRALRPRRQRLDVGPDASPCARQARVEAAAADFTVDTEAHRLARGARSSPVHEVL